MSTFGQNCDFYSMLKKISFGGSGSPLQFIHANGYAPETYTKFLRNFTQAYEVNALKLRPFWPGEFPDQLKSWLLFVDDLIDMMDEMGHHQVVGVGHSLGAVVSWVASIRRPDLFSRLVLIDPVILPSQFIRMSQLTPFWLKKRKLPIVKTALNRRNKWADEATAREHLGSKKVYMRFDKAVFDDFIRYNLKADHEGLTLAYPREWEGRVYATAPNIWPYMPKNKVPVHIIKAQYSDVITSNTWEAMKERTQLASFYEMPGVGHLVPMEKPDELALHILKELQNV